MVTVFAPVFVEPFHVQAASKRIVLVPEEGAFVTVSHCRYEEPHASSILYSEQNLAHPLVSVMLYASVCLALLGNVRVSPSGVHFAMTS